MVVVKNTTLLIISYLYVHQALNLLCILCDVGYFVQGNKKVIKKLNTLSKIQDIIWKTHRAFSS
jgi:hypothetical protein